MSKLSFLTLILLGLFSTTTLSCSSDTSSTNPGSSTEGTAKIDTLAVQFKSSEIGPWEIQIEQLDTLAGIYQIKEKVQQDSLSFDLPPKILTRLSFKNRSI